MTVPAADAFVQLSPDTTTVLAVFGCPQQAPQPTGYAVIQSDDPRLTAFLNKAAVPQSVSRYQALAAMQNAGILAMVQAAVAASSNPLIPLAFANSATFDRNGAFINELAPGLGLSSAQLDALFVAAAQITA
jgi:hypothetical protein